MIDPAAHLLRLQEENPALLAAFDASGRLRHANAAYRAAYGLAGDGALAEGAPEEAPAWADLMRASAALNAGTVIEGEGVAAWVDAVVAGREARPRTLEARLADGRWLLLNENVSADGWSFCVGCDITRLRADVRAVRRDRDEALRAAHTDDLTGVANRRFVIARIEEMLTHSAPAEGPHAPGTLCVLDLDNFKYINDRYGHQVGDAILRDFAGCIRGQVRRTDCFGRIGGEEFVLVLPDTARDEAVGIVERMLGLVRASRPLKELPDFSYTFSCGVAGVRAGDDFASIYRRADKALYAAKMAGRNQVLLEEDDAPGGDEAKGVLGI